MEIFKSKKEQEKAARDAAILQDYSTLLQEYPEARPWKILRTISQKYELSPEWVRTLLIQMGAYITKPQVEFKN